MSRPAIESTVYYGDACLGEAHVFPTTKHPRFHFPNNEIRIAHLSPRSRRCPPLSILHAIAPFSVPCKIEPKTAVTGQSHLSRLHASCFNELKTAVVVIGDQELHLVAMPSKTKNSPFFWVCSVRSGLYGSCLGMLNLRCLAIVFDLDDTLVVANTMRSFEDRIEGLTRRVDVETDPAKVSGMCAELKRYIEDRDLLKQYAETDAVLDDGRLIGVQNEEVLPVSGCQETILRPIIRLPQKNVVLTRINPEVRDTSVFVRFRPAWDDLRSYLTAKGRKRFEVYVCTMSERDYALEIWRLLDPEAHLISSKQLLDRVACVRPGSRKSLQNVFQDGICHPRMAMVIDDRLQVWDENDQPRVHVVPAFTPYYAPQAEMASAVPILCVARNVACNVRGCFFKEFDENLLPKISELCYENDIWDLPYAPDASYYLMSEDTCVRPNDNRDVPISEGTTCVDVEQRLNRSAILGDGQIQNEARVTLPFSVVQEIGRRCDSKVEFSSIVGSSKCLQLPVEVLVSSEKIGIGMDRTKKEAQVQAAESALHNLAYVGGEVDNRSIENENGFVWGYLSRALDESSKKEDLPSVNMSEQLGQSDDSERLSSVLSVIKDLCAEDQSVVFIDKAPASVTLNKGEYYFQVELVGEVLGKGVGVSRGEAKLQAAEEALRNIKAAVDRHAQKHLNLSRTAASNSANGTLVGRQAASVDPSFPNENYSDCKYADVESEEASEEEEEFEEDPDEEESTAVVPNEEHFEEDSAEEDEPHEDPNEEEEPYEDDPVEEELCEEPNEVPIEEDPSDVAQPTSASNDDELHQVCSTPSDSGKNRADDSLEGNTQVGLKQDLNSKLESHDRPSGTDIHRVPENTTRDDIVSKNQESTERPGEKRHSDHQIDGGDVATKKRKTDGEIDSPSTASTTGTGTSNRQIDPLTELRKGHLTSFTGPQVNDSIIPSTASPASAVSSSQNSKPMEGRDEGKVFVTCLPKSVNENKLKELFSPFGQICEAKVVMNSSSGLSRGYGFIKYADTIFATEAVARMNGYGIEGKVITVRGAGRPPYTAITKPVPGIPQSFTYLPDDRGPEAIPQGNPGLVPTAITQENSVHSGPQSFISPPDYGAPKAIPQGNPGLPAMVTQENSLHSVPQSFTYLPDYRGPEVFPQGNPSLVPAAITQENSVHSVPQSFTYSPDFRGPEAIAQGNPGLVPAAITQENSVLLVPRSFTYPPDYRGPAPIPQSNPGLVPAAITRENSVPGVPRSFTCPQDYRGPAPIPQGNPGLAPAAITRENSVLSVPQSFTYPPDYRGPAPLPQGNPSLVPAAIARENSMPGVPQSFTYPPDYRGPAPIFQGNPGLVPAAITRENSVHSVPQSFTYSPDYRGPAPIPQGNPGLVPAVITRENSLHLVPQSFTYPPDYRGPPAIPQGNPGLVPAAIAQENSSHSVPQSLTYPLDYRGPADIPQGNPGLFPAAIAQENSSHSVPQSLTYPPDYRGPAAIPQGTPNLVPAAITQENSAHWVPQSFTYLPDYRGHVPQGNPGLVPAAIAQENSVHSVPQSFAHPPTCGVPAAIAQGDPGRVLEVITQPNPTHWVPQKVTHPPFYGSPAAIAQGNLGLAPPAITQPNHVHSVPQRFTHPPPYGAPAAFAQGKPGLDLPDITQGNPVHSVPQRFTYSPVYRAPAPIFQGNPGLVPRAITQGNPFYSDPQRFTHPPDYRAPSFIPQGNPGLVPPAISKGNPGLVPRAITQGNPGLVPPAISKGNPGLVPRAITQGNPVYSDPQRFTHPPDYRAPSFIPQGNPSLVPPAISKGNPLPGVPERLAPPPNYQAPAAIAQGNPGLVPAAVSQKYPMPVRFTPPPTYPAPAAIAQGNAGHVPAATTRENSRLFFICPVDWPGPPGSILTDLDTSFAKSSPIVFDIGLVSRQSPSSFTLSSQTPDSSSLISGASSSELAQFPGYLKSL